MSERKTEVIAALAILVWLIPLTVFAQDEEGSREPSSDTTSSSSQEYIQAFGERERAVQGLRELLQAEGGSLNEELVLDVQTILTELRNPKFDIDIGRPSLDIPVDDSKLGGIREYIEEKARQTFYKIKIDDIEVEPIE